MHNIFISYPGEENDIVGSLRECLSDVDVKAWAYSYDKTIAKDMWDEINEKISLCKMVVFIVSEHSGHAKGQQKELLLVIDLFKSTRPDLLILPVIVGDISFSDIPERISHINGLYLDAFTKKSTALEIANRLSNKSNIFEGNWERRNPLPCQWLEVCNLDRWTEEFFNLGDYVYFRRIKTLR